MLIPHLLAIAVSVASTSAVYQGFSYGSTFTDTSPVVQSDFQSEFTTAQNLVGTSGFTSARLYTMIQAGTTNTPIEAIPAAIATKTTLLLGLWASAGQADFNNEVAALTTAISQYGTSFTNLIVGIAVGSEDLYRNSPIGIQKNAGVGANPADIINYIGQVRSAIAKTAASGAPVGHVDTYTAWVNSSNDAVISACDFIGMDSYPYFEDTVANSINLGYDIFFQTLNMTTAAAQGKPVWITETGWPVSGLTDNLAVPSIQNAQTYWEQVGCAIFGQINTWWYTLQDSDPTTPNPSFGIVGSQLSTTPLFNLTCPAVVSSTTTTQSTTSATANGGSVSKTHTGASVTSVTLQASASPAVINSTVGAGVSTTGGKLSSGDKGAIAGGVVGGFLLVGAIAALILVLRRKQKDTRDNGNNQVTRDNGNNQVTSDSGYNQDTWDSGYNQDTWDSGNNMDPKDSGNNMPAPERYDGVQGSGLLQYLPRGVRDTLAGDRRRDIEIAGGRLAGEKSEGPIG